jgi:hypothetical protein
MPGSTYSTNLKIELMTTGENSGTWGDITNTNLGTAFEQAVIGLGNPDYTSDANLTITITNSNASQAARCLVLNVTSAFGSLTQTRELIVPTIQKQYIVQNNTTGGQSITVKTSAGTGITVPNGRKAHLYVNGTNVIQMFDFVNILGGTIDNTTLGATTASSARVTTLNASGATTLDGTVALGNAAGDIITVPGTIGSNLVFTDNTYDIGASGATRPRNLFLAGAATVGGNLSVGGTLTLTGGVNLNGNVTVGDTSADTLTINATITSNLLFTDNTYDIGASGATRPRNLFLAGNATIGGAQTLTGALTVDSTTDSTSTTTGSIQTDGGVGIAKALFVGTTGTFGGTLYTQSLYLGNSRVVIRDNSIEEYATNSNAGVAVNYTGYQNGTTQFRDFDIYNGKAGFIATFEGATSRFGLNNTSPSYLFDMTGQGRVLSTSGTSGATIPSNNLFVIDSNANAGFGLAIPSTGNIVGGFYINAGTNTYDGGIDYQGTTRTLNLRSAGTSRIIVDSVGSVGIGVTPNTATFKTLAIGNGSNVGSLVEDLNYNDLGVGSNVYFDSTWKYVKTGEGASLFRLYGYGGTFLWQRASAGTAGANISFTTSMVLNESSYLGIGNPNPAGRLDVLASSATGNAVYFRGGTYTDIAYSTGIRFLQPASTTNANRQFRFTSGDSSLTIQGTDGSGSDVSDAPLLIAPSGGNVAIGATSAAARLDVVRQGNSTGGTIMMSGSKTNAAIKYGALTGAHYTSSTYTQGIGLITSVATSTDNNIQIGGGIDELLAATNIRFWTAANTTTGSGTQRGIFSSAGNFLVGTETAPTNGGGTIGATGNLYVGSMAQNINYGNGISFGNVGLGLLLQQSVNTDDERVYLTNNAQTRTTSGFTGDFAYNKTGAAATAYDTSAGYHRLKSAPTGTAGGTITWTQVLIVGKDTTVALQGANAFTGTGITFPGTQSQSSNANTLDDYEEGSWTPNLAFNGSTTGITYIYRTGTYVKIGRQVTVWATVYLSSKGSATGDATFISLPYQPDQTFYNEQHGCVGELNGVTFSGYLESRVGGTATVNIFQQISGSSFASLNNTSFTNSASMAFTVTYTTNA